jgi:hypothetical protein
MRTFKSLLPISQLTLRSSSSSSERMKRDTRGSERRRNVDMKDSLHYRRKNLFFRSSRKLRTVVVIKGRKPLREASGHLHSRNQPKKVKRIS